MSMVYLWKLIEQLTMTLLNTAERVLMGTVQQPNSRTTRRLLAISIVNYHKD